MNNISVKQWLIDLKGGLEPIKIDESLSKRRRKQGFINEISSIDRFRGKIFIYESGINMPETPVYKVFKFFDYKVMVHNEILAEFEERFKSYIDGDRLEYDNLLNLCIMVKNAGDGFLDILNRNIPHVDRITILDTGSTDNTLNIVKSLMVSCPKPIELYEEPFINFRDSRNRLLDLAGDKCFFNIMLDDTYVIHGRLREFLDMVRGDDVVDSYSLAVMDIDTMYLSNRITKPDRNLRYVNLIHEIIQHENNLNVSIPHEIAYIEDVVSDYMTDRTSKRKQQDIDILLNAYNSDPNDPRTVYYLGTSYICTKEWEESWKWFDIRSRMDVGNKGEMQDALYYKAVIAHMFLNRPQKEYEQYYHECYEFDPTRSEALYFLGKHYVDTGMKHIGYMYLRQAYELGFPEVQMSVRFKIYEYHIPKDFGMLCYNLGRYVQGEEALRKASESKLFSYIDSQYYRIMYHAKHINANSHKIRFEDKPLICFVSAGGWKPWYGATLRETGLGGSETFTIKYAETLARTGNSVIVFCDYQEEVYYNDVLYLPMIKLYAFANTYKINLFIVNRYNEYILACCLTGTITFFVSHDLIRDGDVFVNHPNFRKILCISDWHRQQISAQYPDKIVDIVSYGIDSIVSFEDKPKYMVKHRFIYPSFPNRGLKQLLQMWPQIVKKYPDATLHCFCDLTNNWLLSNWRENTAEVSELLEINKGSVVNFGWVNRERLDQEWREAHVWLYPCTFKETCCLTAYECASSNTLAVSNNLAALNESIADRGVIVQGDCSDPEWQKRCLEAMFEVLDSNSEREYTDRNYEWSLSKSYKNVVGNFVASVNAM